MAGGRSIEQGERARDDATATYAGSPERYVTQLLDTLRQQLDDYCYCCVVYGDSRPQPSRVDLATRISSRCLSSEIGIDGSKHMFQSGQLSEHAVREKLTVYV